MKTQNKKNQRKPHSSLATRISSFYNRMSALWLSISLIVIFLLVVGFSVFSMVLDVRPSITYFEESRDIGDLVYRVNNINAGSFVAIDENKELLATSKQFKTANLELPTTPYIGIQKVNSNIYISYEKNIWTAGRNTTIYIFKDMTILLFELIIIATAAIIMFAISAIIIYLRGDFLTRKALSVLDELVTKANNISSQNLNLRLNVSDSTDELVEIAHTFNHMMDRIEKAYEKQNQFVSDASHELRTPIAVIQGYARMLERWGKDDKDILHESIEAINKESKNMQDLVDKLLFIARNDKDTLVLVKEEFNISELMNEMIRDTQMLETNHIIESQIEANIKIYGDRDRIKQALRVFVDNALKFTDEGKKIAFKLNKEEEFCVITIKDSGLGIPEESIPNIFDRFYQVDNSRGKNGGHGLGLSISRIIVLRHGGRIKVASKEGVGTRFRIFLPLDTTAPSK